MALIEGFRIQNYRSLHNIAMGRIGTDPKLRRAQPLTPLTAVIGKNGSGKSSLFDAFGFLADCMESDLETACNAKGRGGFDKLVSNGFEDKPIKLTFYYRESLNDRPITYEVSIRKNKTGLPVVSSERLRQRAKNQSRGMPRSFLYLENGKGTVWIGDDALEGDHYFYPDAARQISQSGVQKHLNLHGDNVSNVVQYLERNHPIILKKILDDISKKIPGIGTIKTHRDDITNNLYLLFQDKGFAKPFTQQQMSDGTLKMFCYMLLLQDPEPAPFVCIEEPENGLYHKLLETLAAEFRIHATGKKRGSQVFITTHQPYFIDALEPREVWVLEKADDGFSTVKRANKIEFVQNMVKEGQPLGALWYSDYLDAR